MFYEKDKVMGIYRLLNAKTFSEIDKIEEEIFTNKIQITNFKESINKLQASIAGLLFLLVCICGIVNLNKTMLFVIFSLIVFSFFCCICMHLIIVRRLNKENIVLLKKLEVLNN